MPTHGFLERRAGALARTLLGWLRSRVEPGSREWLDALAAESECADNGRQRLRWALGAVPLAFAINKRDQTNDTARGPMRALFAPGIANVAAIAGWYALIIPATYGAARSLRCTLFFGDQPGGCQEHPFVFGAIVLGGAILGMITALALRAKFAAYWWAVFSVVNTVGFVWFLGAGIADVPRYGATQSAMLMAATFGAVFGALSRRRIAAHLVAGAISFAAADSLIRMRDRAFAADSVNHYAILASAMFAAILAGLIAGHWSRLAEEDSSVQA